MKSWATLLSVLWLFLAALSPSLARAQEFRDLKAGLTGMATRFDVFKPMVSLGDFDKDGDLDLLMAGAGELTARVVVEVHRNDNGKFTRFTDFSAMEDSLTVAVDWADLDKDGNFELIMWVRGQVPVPGGLAEDGIIHVYSYDPGAGAFVRKALSIPIPGVLFIPMLRLADVDDDGFPDLLISGDLNDNELGYVHPYTRILRNLGGKGFADITGTVPSVSMAATAFKDLDGDRKLELFLAGSTMASGEGDKIARIYRFNGTAYEDYATLPFKDRVASADFGDIDGDGRQDLILSGQSIATRLFLNTGTGFALDTDVDRFDVSVDAGSGSVSFGDIDGDGDPDLLVAGEGAYPPFQFTRVYTNDGGYFYDLQHKIPPFWNCLAKMVDFDRDGNADLFLAGTSLDDRGQSRFSSVLYRNIRGDFHPLAQDLDSLDGNRARWLDFDNDKDLDLVASGSGPGAPNGGLRFYRNDAGALVKQSTPFDDLYGDPEPGDLDGDGRLDILVTGKKVGGMKVLRNTGSGFAEVALRLTGDDGTRIEEARVADYDNDGDLDIVGWGTYRIDPTMSDSRCHTALLRNDGGWVFTAVNNGQLPGLCDGEMQWGDFDRDGDADLLFAGDTVYAGESSSTSVYRNDGGIFIRTEDRFVALTGAKVAWGDFDKDGDLDFVESGRTFIDRMFAPATIVYRLVGGRFEEYKSQVAQLAGYPAWIDFDNDGDLDLSLSGDLEYSSKSGYTLLYRNDGIDFTLEYPEGSYQSVGRVDVGDYDNDGDEDFVLCGNAKGMQTGTRGPVLRIYRNTLLAPNLRPAAPPAAKSALGAGSVNLSWSPATDAETQAEAMRYNLRMGRSPGAADVMSPAAAAEGKLLLPAAGNAGHRLAATVKGLAQGTYYWSVQAVDKQNSGSPFSPEQSFTLGLPAPTLVSAEAGPGPGAVTVRWNRLSQPHFQRYYLHYGAEADPVERRDSISRAGDTVFTITGLTNGTTYHFRLSAVDVGGNVSAYSGQATAVPDGAPPAVPDPVAAEPGDRAVTLTWRAATEADFLCYLVYQRNASGPIEKIDSIIDIGAVSKRIGGLKNGTPYGFLVVAVDKVLNHSGFSSEAVAIPAYLITPSSPSLAFGDVHLGGSGEASVRISNASDLPVAVDSVRFINAAFGLTGALASLPAKAETTLTVRFLPGKPAGGDFTGVMKLYYGAAKNPLEIDLTGRASARPYCSIDKISPAEIPWDTAASLSFHSSANDSDNAGEGDRITAFLWSSSLAGAFGENASGFIWKPSDLGIGTHTVTLRVVDNEGDTSLAATASLIIRGRKPLARLEPLTPAGLIIRGADRPRFRATAYDLDEGADAAHDSLKSFALMSTLQGLLSSSKDTTLEKDALALGLHGFYAVAVDDEGDSARSDTTWVPVQTGVGMALLVAGTDFNDNRYFYENISPNCNWVYTKLRQRGFTDSLITYFNPVGWQSIGGAYHENSNIVDETRMTRGGLKERILGYKERVRNGVPLVISLVGHGSRSEQNGKFYLSPDEFLTPDSLSSWLDTYNRDEEGHVTGELATPIVIVLDFCYSGSFLAKLRSSSQNRVVIASASAERQSYFQNGQSFSYAFFKQIGKGGNLAQAWAAGKVWSDANTLIGQERANPVADADNDNLPNETEDLARMTQIYIGGSQQDQSPEARWKEVRLDFSLASQSLTLRAVAEGPAPVDTAWFTLLAPDFDFEAGAADPFTVIPLKRQADGSFAATVKLEPVLDGDYLALVYGLSGGQEMMPAAKRQQTLSSIARSAGKPVHFGLGQNFPNPSADRTWLPFSLTRHGAVSLTIMDMRGRVVRKLASGMMQAGIYALEWDGRDGRGRIMPAGVYTYALQSKEGTRRRKLVRGN
jgi:VCBS repeat protein/flagellar hook capping protein FlgD/ASPM-SPD-2-Hydin domain-containing protein/fibronectin type III domain protein